MKGIYYDSESKVVNERFAVIYAPRKQRQRFPENCVTVMDNEQEAKDAADHANKLYAAKVLGPSRSSEGLRLFYLVHWL